MPRRGTIKKRKAPVDTLYGSTVVARQLLFLDDPASWHRTLRAPYEATFRSLGLLAPYLERLWFRLATPSLSRVPRTMW